MKKVAPKAVAGGLLLGCFAGIVFFSVAAAHRLKEREQMERELEMWKQDPLDERRREFMDQMERKHQ